MKGTKTLLSYLLFIIGLQWKTVYALPSTCSDGEYMCLNKRCINGQWKCDGEDDCGDGSDEKKEDCPAKTCGPNKFKCGNNRCIPMSWTCDNMNDCGDNSDETTAWLKCPKSQYCDAEHFQCAKTKQCIMRYEHCDGYNDCGEGDTSDEQNCEKKTCATDEFQCNNGHCIQSSWFCDNNKDCTDGSDEVGCNTKPCKAGQFKCKKSGYCISSDSHCDGVDDCHDGSDEKLCTLKTTAQNKGIAKALIMSTNSPTYASTKQKTSLLSTTSTTTTEAPCLDFQFKCHKSNSCIHKSWICDKEPDCANGEDEAPETCSVTVCTDEQYRCGNGKCIDQILKCDGTHHCPDGSDEKDCSIDLPCHKGTFQCANSSKCIDYSMVCNSKNDCPEGDDEHISCGKDECLENNGGCHHDCTDKDIGFECRCRLGYKLSSDGKSCDDLDDCQEFGICSQKCINTKGSFKCECGQGYTLINRRSCKAEAPEPQLVFANEYDIRSMLTSGKDYRSISTSRGASAVAVDVKDEMIYWTDMVDKTISRIHRNKSSKPEVLVRNVQKPESLAVDWLHRKIYWIDTGKNELHVSNLDGSHAKLLIKGTTNVELRTLAVYPEKQFLYWSDWGVEPKIERANLIGEDRKTILTHEHVKWTSSIAVDPTIERIFWVDMSAHRICSSDIDGNDMREIVTGLSSPYGVAVFEDFVYWTDSHLKKLYKADKFKGSHISPFGSFLYQPMDIRVYHPLLQKKYAHPCADVNNGGCSHLCFATSDKQRICDCPRYMKLKEDGKTCIYPVSSTTSPSPTVPITSTTVKTTSKEKQTNQPTTIPPHHCEYACHSSRLCIMESEVCDGKFDCPEHDDEKHCEKVVLNKSQTKLAENTSAEKDTSNIIIVAAVVPSLVLILLVVAFGYYCKQRRSRAGLSIVYETDADRDSKDEKDGVFIRKLPSKQKKTSRSDKNFDNINFKPYEEVATKEPFQMNDVYGDTVVDEYPGGDDPYDDRTPIIPRFV